MCDPFRGASAEVCVDGLDNDCDGVVDDGCAGGTVFPGDGAGSGP